MTQNLHVSVLPLYPFIKKLNSIKQEVEKRKLKMKPCNLKKQLLKQIELKILHSIFIINYFSHDFL